jgi:hypothetical protein
LTSENSGLSIAHFHVGGSFVGVHIDLGVPPRVESLTLFRSRQLHGQSVWSTTVACLHRVSCPCRLHLAVAHRPLASASMSNDYPDVRKRDLKGYDPETTGKRVGRHNKRMLATLSMDGKVSALTPLDCCLDCCHSASRQDLACFRLPFLPCHSSFLTSYSHRSAS